MKRILLVVLLCGCAGWTPVVHRFPSGLTVVRGDQTLVSQACANGLEISRRGSKRFVLNDNGEKVSPRSIIGCYQKSDDTIYLLNNNVGAKALLHELAHREGIADPEAEGFDWEGK